MNIEILEYNSIENIIPSIEDENMFSIAILFKDNTCVVCGYLNKKEFTNDYKLLLSNWRKL